VSSTVVQRTPLPTRTGETRQRSQHAATVHVVALQCHPVNLTLPPAEVPKRGRVADGAHVPRVSPFYRAHDGTSSHGGQHARQGKLQGQPLR
jgi:hypothetical protein